MKTSTKIEQQDPMEIEDEEDDDESAGSLRLPHRIRSHSLAPRHSKYNYNRRKSTSDDLPNKMITRLDSSNDKNSSDCPETPPSDGSSNTTKQRRFTLFTLESQRKNTNQDQRRMTTGRFSLFNEKSSSDLLEERRPKIFSQMVESFARRFSLRKKKNNHDSEQDETVVDPVYETLKIAAETRKMTLANYLQQRQQTLNKQTSLNSQGSSEPDIQPSPRISRQNNRTDTEINSSSRTTSINPNPSTSQRQQQTQSNASATSLENARVTNC